VRPSPSQNLIALYDLNEIADSVRRYDAVTGAKINKLRKSYAGKLKDLNIVGRTKNMEKELPMPGVLYPGMMEPKNPQDWDVHNAASHSLRTADFSLDRRLDAAMKMAPGKLPPQQAHRWNSLIGLDEVAKPKNIVLEKQKAGASMSRRPSGAATPIPETNAPVRATRGVKRSYQDPSFVGYAEGFGDEESDMTDADSRPLKKKKFGKV
jgi:Rox3 mediator complex subunit